MNNPFTQRGPIALALGLCLLAVAACATGTAGRAASAPREGAAAGPSWSGGEPNGGRAPAFSPDGTRIAFLSSTLHTPPDLWVMNADGSAKRRLTSRGASSFRWAPDGQAIHFTARRKGYDEVLSVGIDGSGREERVQGLPPNAGLPAFSPDGSLFAFTAPVPGGEGIRDLWVGTIDRSRVEAVTEKINIRSFFWGPAGRKVFYQAGKTYSLGLWEMDLATMESKPLVVKYTGDASFSPKAGRIAYPYPTDPGKFEVHTLRADGTDVRKCKAARLGERRLAWAADGSGVYYLGRELPPSAAEPRPETRPARQGRSGRRLAGGATSPARADGAAEKKPTPIAPHGTKAPDAPEGPTSLWFLDLNSGVERRVSPAELHVADYALSPDGHTALVSGVLPASRAPEIFRVDLGSGESTPLATSRPSAWMPTPSPDATRIAYFTNAGPLDALHVADLRGKELARYPGFALGGGAKLFWLPKLDGFLVFSEAGLHGFSEKGPIAFPKGQGYRALLGADVSLHEDRVLVSAVPLYGETPGLYALSVVGDAFVQADLRFPPAPEKAAEQYLQPRWSLDGRRVAFTDGTDVWTMNADGLGRRRLTAYAEANAAKQGAPALASFPVWSVSGDLLAYTLTVYDGKRVRRELWTLGADGSSPRRVFSEELDSQFQVFLPEYTSPPFFDPSDRHLVVTALHRGLPNVLSIDLADGQARALTESGAIFPAMLPEEDAIVYTALEGNAEAVWVMGADGSGKRPLLAAGAEQRGGSGEPAPAAR